VITAPVRPIFFRLERLRDAPAQLHVSFSFYDRFFSPPPFLVPSSFQGRFRGGSFGHPSLRPSEGHTFRFFPAPFRPTLESMVDSLSQIAVFGASALSRPSSSFVSRSRKGSPPPAKVNLAAHSRRVRQDNPRRPLL